MAATCGGDALPTSRRGSSSARRGSRGSSEQQQQQQHGNNRYVSVSVRVLDGGSGTDSLTSNWIEFIWPWMESQMSACYWWGLLGFILIAACWVVDWLRLYMQLCSLVVPFFALTSGYLFLALSFRHSWTSTGIYLTFCGSVVGEVVGFFLYTSLFLSAESSDQNQNAGHLDRQARVEVDVDASSLLLHPFYLLGYTSSLVVASRLTNVSSFSPDLIAAIVVFLRSVGCVSLPASLPLLCRPVIIYLAGLIGVLAAKFVEASLCGVQPEIIAVHPSSSSLSPAQPVANNTGSRRPSTSDAADSTRVVASRRRRTSSVALQTPVSTSSQGGQQQAQGSGVGNQQGSSGTHKVRRTSLPALLANKNPHLLSSSGSSAPWGLDVALLSEAHGLVTDLLLESATMPPQLVGGLKALANLLSPPLPFISSVAGSCNPSSSSGKDKIRHNLPHVALSDVYYASDTEEIPYTGETLLHLSKRGKRFVPPNLLRRMSTSTWTTTTSATGMPTIEAEPSRKRTASFRTGSGGGSGTADGSSCSPNQSQTCLPVVLNAEVMSSGRPNSPGCNKNRSQSATSLYAQQLQQQQHHHHPNGKRLMRERKTVCSLHPLSSSSARDDYQSDSEPKPAVENDSENEAVHSSSPAPSSAIDSRRGSGISTRRSSGAGSGGSRRGSTQQPVVEDQQQLLQLRSSVGGGGGSDCEAPESGVRIADYVTSRSCYNSPAAPQALTPDGGTGNGGGRRVRNFEQDEDYEDDDEQGALGASQHHHRGHHHRSGGSKPRTSDYESSDSPNSSDHCDESKQEDRCLVVIVRNDLNSASGTEEQDCSLVVDPASTEDGDGVHQVNEVLNSRLVLLDDGSRYDLDQLESDQLLDDLKDWDYPIFDLLDHYGDKILSATCYRVFVEVGLFEAFKIPVREFFHFFHALELGYREKPYHNRTHASDVLHAVYYLTSQPIPGFTVRPFDTNPASSKSVGSDAASPALIQRASFNFEDSYGIMGANFPALELMALYTAATMHDYDHPGRTNAFLVSTLAPQAILYNDRSVLENHHAAAAWSLFLSNPRFNFLVHLERAEFKRFRYLIIEAILATDLKRHFEILAEFNAKVNDADAPGIDWTNETDRLLAMQMCIKLADINGPCKIHDIHVRWTYSIAEEFYEQGDEEAKLGLPISPYMDRNNPQLAKLQESFINHLVAPLCNAYGEAGLLPGEWDDNVDDEEDDGSLPNSVSDDERIGTSSDAEDSTSLSELDAECRLLSDGSISGSDSETPVHSKRLPAGRKIICLQTQHLQENHRYWVAKIKESELRPVADPITHNGPAAESSSRCSSPVSLNEDRMEPIEEENSPKSFDRNFSFQQLSASAMQSSLQGLESILGHHSKYET